MERRVELKEVETGGDAEKKQSTDQGAKQGERQS